MKILSINYEYPPIGGGGGVVCRGLVENLVRMGHTVDLVTSGMKSLPSFEVCNGVRIHRTQSIRLNPHYTNLPEMLTMPLAMYRKALALTRRNRYRYNHTHFVFPSGIASWLLNKKTGLPYILTCHGSDVPGYNPDRFQYSHKLLLPFWKGVLKGSNGISAPSNYLKQLIQSQVDVPVEVIPNGYQLPDVVEGTKKNRIIAVTRMLERKGVQFFIRAMEQIDTDWEILVAGDGPYLGRLKTLARNVPAIRFLGCVRGKELEDLYRSAKIFVFVSSRENFPIVLLEAMSHGCAVVTSDAQGCAEVVGKAAIKTPYGDVDAIRRAVERLTRDESEIQGLSDLALEHVSQFAWSKISGRFVAYSKQCLNNSIV